MSDKRYQIENQIAALQKQLANMSLLPETDDYPNGAMIRLVTIPKYSNRGTDHLTYLLLKVVRDGADDSWYFTGRLDLTRTDSARSLSFHNLIDLITRHHTVVEWDQLTAFKSTAIGDSPNYSSVPLESRCEATLAHLRCLKPAAHVSVEGQKAHAFGSAPK